MSSTKKAITNNSSTIHSAPYHPATVHFPIAFLSLAYALDVLYGLASHPSTAPLTRSLYNLTPLLGDIARASHYLTILGLLTAVPAVLTGGQQLLAMIKKQDLAKKMQRSDNKAATAKGMHPKLKVAFAHAGLNDLAVGAAAYNWWTRSQAVNYAPSDLNVLLSAVVLPTILFSAYLGGELVYGHGVGVSSRVKAE